MAWNTKNFESKRKSIRTVSQIERKLLEQLLFFLISFIQKSPELKVFYHIPEAYNTEAEVLNADEIKQPADNLFKIYSDIIESTEADFSQVLHSKAVELNNQGIRAPQIKHYSESLYHVIKYELQNELNADEQQLWAVFTKQISTQVTLELSKFPRKSIIST